MTNLLCMTGWQDSLGMQSFMNLQTNLIFQVNLLAVKQEKIPVIQKSNMFLKSHKI